ncbi:histidine ammonia-lyase-like [Lingula anatina]|uniref:Histidine ammonia-lyase-like n=1 Tax=Lingula anatina TaxID=7574 RepID=A0A1S3HQQ7_LINAN|nr:histidine ammonia-lyase-like [Lingula anatina]|eukprot:XP_013388388.1 histidine ammonia-lyase-like [Lingula anatina]
MKLSVRVRGEWFAVPCSRGNETIGWLGEEALRRYTRNKSGAVEHDSNKNVTEIEKVFEVRKTQGGAILDPADLIKSVLDDNEFVSVVLESDVSSPITGPVEVTYIPEQVPGSYILPNEVSSFSMNVIN